ncbi:hypothetical protein FQR65_LT12510 [Abscondita terminalis]|nr:hypothetical protein FQR65_LT12510 [Abscondita terminalis]
MESGNIVCPVCTLYLRPGITLKAHLTSHPKQKVIEALVNLTNYRNDKEVAVPTTSETTPTSVNWTQPVSGFSQVPGNHSFIYQQFMSTTSQPPNVVNVNPITQQYITIPTVFNPQLMCQPYMYHQQQQVIMSAGTAVPPPLIRKPTIVDLSSEPENFSDSEGLNNENQNNVEMDESVAIDDKNKNNKFDEAGSNEDLHEEVFLPDDSDESKLQVKADIQDINRNDNVASPASSEGSDYFRVRNDLNKACQTQHVVNVNNDVQSGDEGEHESEPCFDHRTTESEVQNLSTVPLHNSFEGNDLNYSPNNLNILQANDQVIDMDGMQLVLCNDFMGSQLISQVEDFECINNRSERTILMNIGGMDAGSANDFNGVDQLCEESISRESTNISIRADEPMPPRGELSGQESNGAASDIAWNRVNYEGSSVTSTSYDLYARETWEGSDCSDGEVPPLQSRNPPPEQYNPEADDTPTIVSVTEAPLNFKCPVCGQGFKCPKERRVHQTEVHSKKEDNEKNNKPPITIKSGKKPTKKILIKPKKINEIKSENNFDSVFVNLNLDTTPVENREPSVLERDSVIAAINGDCKVDDKGDVKFSPQNIQQNTNFPDGRKKSKPGSKTYSKAPYKCDTCEEMFKTEYLYNIHLQKHPLECQLCAKYFYRKNNLQLHMKRHLGIKPYLCEFCQKSFFTKQKLDEHKNTHTGESPIKCSMCDESFRRYSNLVQHRNHHHLKVKKKVKDYVCYCGEIVHSKKKLAWHKEIHDAKPKSCAYCTEKFVHMSSLTRHMRRAHNERFVPAEDRSNENVECPICKGVFLKSSLEVHIRNHSGHRPFTCSVCNKDFTTKWNLKLHKWTHAARASKPYKCDQCKGAFIRETDYVAHMNSHKSVRPYTCNYCGAQFIRKYNCQRHVREHEKAKTFSCQVCGKSFHRSYYLKDHMRVHSGLRPFACHVCGKTSTTKSNHNKHVMIHHAKEPVSTEN